jgi:putative phosphoesterase
MLLGILSDSHGRADVTRAAVAALVRRGAATLVHLGDICGENVLDELISHNARVVFGNCDWEIRGLTHYAQAVGVQVDHPMGMLEIDGKSIAFTHGHLTDLMDQALAANIDYLLHGHTHEVRDERIGRTRVINPGALHRASRYTAALLDPVGDRLEIVDIGKDLKRRP